MQPKAVKKAIEDAREFVRRGEKLWAKFNAPDKPDWHHIVGTAESGALRRQSLELTRALAEMRKP